MVFKSMPLLDLCANHFLGAQGGILHMQTIAFLHGNFCARFSRYSGVTCVHSVLLSTKNGVRPRRQVLALPQWDERRCVRGATQFRL